MQTLEKTEYPALKRLGSQIGYGVAVGVSLVFIYVVWNLEEWGIFPFLTDEFGEVVPWIIFSLAASIAALLAYIAFEGPRVRWIGEISTNLVTIAVAWKMLAVFPFDFSAYDFPWETVARAVLILAIVGAAIGTIADIWRLARIPEDADIESEVRVGTR